MQFEERINLQNNREGGELSDKINTKDEIENKLKNAMENRYNVICQAFLIGPELAAEIEKIEKEINNIGKDKHNHNHSHYLDQYHNLIYNCIYNHRL